MVKNGIACPLGAAVYLRYFKSFKLIYEDLSVRVSVAWFGVGIARSAKIYHHNETCAPHRRNSKIICKITPSPPLFKEDTRGQKKWLFWYHQHGCTRTWQRLKYYVTPKFCTWCVNFVKKPGKLRFSLVNSWGVKYCCRCTRLVLSFFFLILCVKQDHDQDVGYDDFMQFVFVWNFLKVCLCCHNNKN